MPELVKSDWVVLSAVFLMLALALLTGIRTTGRSVESTGAELGLEISDGTSAKNLIIGLAGLALLAVWVLQKKEESKTTRKRS